MVINYIEWLGHKVAKKDSSLFRSGKRVNKIRYVIDHPITGKKAFQFEDDNSCVEAEKCILVNEK